MDTREKIQSLHQLRASLAREAWTVVAGCFDPLTASEATRLERLAEPGRKLLAVVQPDADELLNIEARAALVAALRAVDAVLIETSNAWRDIARANPSVRIVEDAAGDRERRAAFERFVQRRSRAAPAT